MIRLAANGSPILLRLLETQDLPLDCVKCPLSANSPQEVAAFRPHRPVLLHGWGPNYWIGQRTVPRPDLLRELMAVSGSPYLSTHLDVQADDFDDAPSSEEMFSRFGENADALREITGRNILLENIPYFPWGESDVRVVAPEFIGEALRRTGADLLLDLAHARVSAGHTGQDFPDCLDAFPLERVVEVHLSRPRLEADGMRDRHLPLEDEDYELFQRLLPRLPNLQTVALEYGGLKDLARDGVTVGRNDPDALRDQILRLRAVLEAYDAAGR